MDDRNRFPGTDVLLFLILTTAHLWFNPVSSALVVTAAAGYVLLSAFFPAMPDETERPTRSVQIAFLCRLAIVLFVVMVAAILPMGLNILQRRAEGPATNAHDGLIQTEVAINYILQGINPYAVNYLDSPMADFKGGEPPYTSAPLYHNVYLPFLFILSIPFYKLSQALLGWYDQRFVYLLAYIGVLWLLPQLIPRQRDRLSLLAILGLEFLFPYFLAEGRNDVIVLFGLVLTTLLVPKHPAWAALVLGFTLVTKQTAWLFLPFFLVYVMPLPFTRASMGQVARWVWPILIGPILVVLPFLIWNAPAFLDDTIGYVIGTSATSFPIKGWGLSTLFLAAHIIPSAEAQFPFGLIQLGLGLPLLGWLALRQRGDNTLRQMWLGFAVFSFVFMYTSRFFNDNYVIFVLQALVIGFFIAPLCRIDRKVEV